MNQRSKSIVKFVVRWGIAVLGIGWVVSNVSLYNRVLVAGANGRPVPARLTAPAKEDDSTFPILDPLTKTDRTVDRHELFVKSDSDKITIRDDAGAQHVVELLGLKVIDDPERAHWPLVVAQPRNIFMRFIGTNHGDAPRIVLPTSIVGDYSIRVPYPIIEAGLGPMTRLAFQQHPLYLLLAVAVFCITFIITSFRWHMLLKCLEIQMSLGRTFVINMVGAFYNTFLPGSTGGDVLKAYYAAKQTPHRTRAVMSVIVDRVLGLLALVLMGGTAATVQYFTAQHHDAATRKCGQVALGSAAIIFATAFGLLFFYNRTLRKFSGLDFILKRLPMQTQVQKALDTMELYRTHWLAVLIAILITLPVHGAVVVSASFAGKAFGLPITWPYYWVAVPVIVLSGSIPISPQGAGVMEFFAILLTRSHGVTVSQAFALTMSIRVVQILWNLFAGIFVLKGGFHAPTSEEQHELEADSPTINRS